MAMQSVQFRLPYLTDMFWYLLYTWADLGVEVSEKKKNPRLLKHRPPTERASYCVSETPVL